MIIVTRELGQIGLAEPLILAVDNGGTNTRLLLREGEAPVESRVYTTPRDYGEAIETMHVFAKTMAGKRKIDAIGFAIAGKIADGCIVSAGELQDYGWVGELFQEDVAQEFGIESDLVILHNDCVAAAKAQQVANVKVKGAESGYVATISTGFGGAGFRQDELIPDEPGHEFLKEGAVCGCGGNGCAEAHISGSGIERKYGLKAEDLSPELWQEVLSDTVEAHALLLQRFEKMGFMPASLHYFGSVAIKGPNVLQAIRQGLMGRRDEVPFMPGIALATHGEDSGLVGAGDSALALIF